jgi:inositol phosphorylceramide synthase catalytic subunit
MNLVSDVAGLFLKAITALRHHFLLLLPIGIWLVMFQFTALIQPEFRPEIDVTTLPYVERVFFGTPFLFELIPLDDVLITVAAAPYLCHFMIPWIYAVYLLAIDAKPFTFLWLLGILNILAVATQVIFPTAAPWYNYNFGTLPASYEMTGDPGRFIQVDAVLGVRLFEGLYGQSPLVFGSFPSLHGAWPFLIALYSTYLALPGHKFIWFYMLWVWFAAVYSKHHYLIDLVGGAVYTLTALVLSKYFLAFDVEMMRMKPEKSQTH